MPLTKGSTHSRQGSAGTTATPTSIVQVSVSLTRQGKEYTSTRRIPLHDEWGNERDTADIAAGALARAIRDVYGKRAYWVRDHGTSSSLAHRTDLQIYEYGNVVRDLTDQERQQGHANVIASRVQAEVHVLE